MSVGVSRSRQDYGKMPTAGRPSRTGAGQRSQTAGTGTWRSWASARSREQEALDSSGSSTHPTPHLRAAGELVLPDLPKVGLAFKQPFGRFRRRLHRTEQKGLSAHVHVSWPRSYDRLLAGLVCRAEHKLIAPLVPGSGRRGNGEHCRKLLAIQLRGDLDSGSRSRA
jgi:hypothetical protein